MFSLSCRQCCQLDVQNEIQSSLASPRQLDKAAHGLAYVATDPLQPSNASATRLSMKVKPTLHHDLDQSELHNFELFEMAELSADCKLATLFPLMCSPTLRIAQACWISLSACLVRQ